jgi:dihydrofolate synthase/folylpolyglutamate synthase
MNHISKISFDKLYMVLGFVSDKDLSPIISLLPKDAYYFFCQAQIPRALDAEVLQKEAFKYGLQGEVIKSVNEAISGAREKASPIDMIFIGGSTFVVAEIEEL